MNRFTKDERLCSRKQITALLTGGASFFVYPFRVVYEIQAISDEGQEAGIQLLIAVPKRKIKKAVRRNLVKRRTREAWRLCKQDLYTTLATTPVRLSVMLQYVADEPLPFAQIEAAVMAIRQQLGVKFKIEL